MLPLNLPIILETVDFYCINKPANVTLREIRCPDADMRSRPPIYLLDQEISGVVLFAKNERSFAILRNAYGSENFEFHFIVIAKNSSSLNENITCQLPIAQHREKDCMLISRSTGKKSRTIFRRLGTFESFAIWSAEVKFLRKHQIRLHAHEVGLEILGEDIYNSVLVPSLADFKSRVKDNRKGSVAALYPSVCIHLAKICFEFSGENYAIESPLPKKLSSMIKIIQKWS